MKRFIIVYLLLLGSCQKYEQTSELYLTGGKWTVTKVSVNGIPCDTVVLSETGILNTVNNQIMSDLYDNAPIERRIISGKTKWEFDNSGYSLQCDNFGREEQTLNVWYTNKNQSMTITNPYSGLSTPYTIGHCGENYPLTLQLMSSVVLESQGGDEVFVVIDFMRH